ncbi:MAG: nuclease-related domain-containing protein [Thermoleophilaceae bacterium]
MSKGNGIDRYMGIGVALAIGAFGNAYLDLGSRWQRGAGGERRVGRQLERLAKRGWTISHDLPKSSGGNIDHVTLGPGGAMFTIETKLNRFGGRELGQARSHAGYLERALDHPVTPVLCVANGKSKPKLYAGVWCVGSTRLVAFLDQQTTGRRAVDPELVTRLSQRCELSG